MNMNDKTIIGIDPGANGAISFTTTDNKIRKKNRITAYKCDKSLSGRTIVCTMAKQAYHKKIIAYIEKVHAMPHDGRSSLFKFGTNYGVWMGILESNNIEYELVMPKKWQKDFNLPKIKKERKQELKTIEVSPQKWMRWWETKLDIKLPKEKKDRKKKLKEIASEYIDINQKPTLWNADSILITMYGVYTEKEKNVS